MLIKLIILFALYIESFLIMRYILFPLAEALITTKKNYIEKVSYYLQFACIEIRRNAVNVPKIFTRNSLNDNIILLNFLNIWFSLL